MIDAETKIYSAIKLGDRITRSQSQDRGRALSSIPSSDYRHLDGLVIPQHGAGRWRSNFWSRGCKQRFFKSASLHFSHAWKICILDKQATEVILVGFRQMSINQKSGRQTFRGRFASGSLFVCYFLENLSVAGIILQYIAAGRGLFTECLHLFSFRLVLYFLRCIRTGVPQYFLWFEMFRVSSGMFVQKNRKIGNSGLARIEKIGKIGNFALTNRRKIGKSKVLLSTKIASLHPIRVIIKATSPHILCSQDLDQLSRLRSENHQ